MPEDATPAPDEPGDAAPEPGDEVVDHYAILEVPKFADFLSQYGANWREPPRDLDDYAALLKNSYRRLALLFHPDKNPGDPGAEEQFKRIGAAYAVLSDQQSRAFFEAHGNAVDRTSFERAQRQLHGAAAEGDVLTISVALAQGAEVDAAENASGMTALMAASAGGFVGAIAALIKAGAQIEKKGSGRWTALLHASTTGAAEAVAALLVAGADPDAANILGRTSLMLAAALGTPDAAECLEKLLAAGADAAPTSKTGHWKGLTALQLAQQNRNPGQREVMEKLFAEAAQRRAADQ